MLVYFFVTAGGHALEFAGPGDLFEEANRRAGRRVYDVHFVSLRPGLVTCLSGAQLMLEGTMRDRDEPLDTLIVTGAREPLSRLGPEIANWLRRQTPRTRRYGAIGTGAFLLGAAGLLDNKHVTTD